MTTSRQVIGAGFRVEPKPPDSKACVLQCRVGHLGSKNVNPKTFEAQEDMVMENVMPNLLLRVAVKTWGTNTAM